MMIGEQLRRTRLEKGLSQREMYRRTGLMPPYISKVECGYAVSSVETLEKFARGLEEPLHILVHRAQQLRTVETKGRELPGRSERILALLPKLDATDRAALMALAKGLARTRK